MKKAAGKPAAFSFAFVPLVYPERSRRASRRLYERKCKPVPESWAERDVKYIEFFCYVVRT